MATSPITSWQIDGKKIETITDFFSWAQKITADSDCSHEIKRHLLLGNKSYTKHSVLKCRETTLPAKIPIVKVTLCPIVTYGCESWSIKKAKHWRIDVFKLMLEKTLESPLNKPVNPKEINHEYWLEGLILWSWSSNTLATWCKELTHWKRPWCWERLKVGGGWNNRGWEVGWYHWFDGREFEQALGVGDEQGSLACCSPWDGKKSEQ